MAEISYIFKKMKSRVQLCSKNPFSNSRDIFNEIFCRQISQIYQNLSVFSSTRWYFTEFNKPQQNFKHLTKFHGIKLWFLSVLFYFVNYCFHICWFQKSSAKFQSHLDLFKFGKFCTWQWRTMKKSLSQLPTSLAFLITLANHIVCLTCK